MPSPIDKITNPEALKLIHDIQSGVIFAPLIAKIIKYKWYIISGFILLVLIIAISFGRAIFRRSQAPIFTPPDIGLPEPTVVETFTSEYEWIRQNIIDFGTELPDPVLPALDNAIDLESVNI
ncbi:MAG: hypothetical protein UW68_C0003G0016 [Candidatus Collierbacteria bacterium GW2011_GWB1_44_6]|uniref:Uncharacterized protein n=2 Tax=Candidatus Collieribacteriota TaxID=1752725 RepID=A0A0G1JQM2_9BACT|nr:MAG: hypothetical protein UV68_C0025G0013 [Candidatus Collierbacteria bacterium GW2011_GWC2_43_12]KKT73695.1 MAG: hypothetical protein UW68_C0003G0016 [Candidatus Collierbacteria bacterium GW2011_GWB1_44_6]KKT83462.1 MAG: hypothetical protein UW80_C0013G0002 [Microgenomates group bacterium GW2011_GWC1_44_9]